MLVKSQKLGEKPHRSALLSKMLYAILLKRFWVTQFQWTQGTAMLQLPALVSQSTALAALQLSWEAPSQMLLPLMHGWKQLVFYIPVQVRWIPYQYLIAPWKRPTSAIARLTR